MNLVFAGTPVFAACALQALLDAGHTITLVLTQPDRPAGRGMQLQASAVKQLALQQGLTLAQPARMNDMRSVDREKLQQADICIVAAYGRMLPGWFLEAPRLGCLNIHASLLPRWRGAAPIQRCIEAGDAVTGITIMQVTTGLDTGPICLQASLSLRADETSASLHDRLSDLGARLCVQALALAEAGTLPTHEQPEVGVTYAHKILKHEALLDWRLDAWILERKVRALAPTPLAQTRHGSVVLKIHQAQAQASSDGPSAVPGTVLKIDGQGIHVACGHGTLALQALQRPAGRCLSHKDFVRGYPLAPGTVFTGAEKDTPALATSPS